MSDLKYDRLKLIPNWKQERIANAKVAVIGCGALGNEVIKNLALLGVGQIWVVDYDTIEIHNLTRSVLFRESDIGKYKADVVTDKAREINPDIQVHPIIGKLELAMGRGLLRDMDVVIGCLDGVGARRLLNSRCYFAGVPWIDGGISHRAGNVALFNPQVPESACYRCKMDTSAWERLNERYSCGFLKDDYQDPKLATTIMTASIVAAYQVEIATQLILGDSNFVPGTQLSLPVTLPVGFMTINFSVDEKCPDHDMAMREKTTSPDKFSLNNTPREVAEKLDLGGSWKLELPFDFVSNLTCHTCQEIEAIRKPQQEIKQGDLKCPHCKQVSREPTICFQITSDSDNIDLTFKEFGLCYREIIHCSKFMDDERTDFKIELI
jgi:molybdopterin/thiamine biosynthesis adenylyltransferase